MQRNHFVFGRRHVVTVDDSSSSQQSANTQTAYREHWELTGSCGRRTRESNSCCKDTAGSARETGSGPSSPRPRCHTPDTADAAAHSRKSCRSTAQLGVTVDPPAPPPAPTALGLTCWPGLSVSAAYWEATATLRPVQGQGTSAAPSLC